MCRMGRRSLWFDVNRPAFDEDMHDKRFLYFRFQWPWPLTFRGQIYFPSYTCLALFPLNCKVFTAFVFRENRRHGTDRRTGATLSAAPTDYGGSRNNFHQWRQWHEKTSGTAKHFSNFLARTNRARGTGSLGEHISTTRLYSAIHVSSRWKIQDRSQIKRQTTQKLNSKHYPEKSKQRQTQQNKTRLVQSLLTTLGHETRMA